MGWDDAERLVIIMRYVPSLFCQGLSNAFINAVKDFYYPRMCSYLD